MPDLEVEGEESEEEELEDEEGDNVVVMEEEEDVGEDDEAEGEGESHEKWKVFSLFLCVCLFCSEYQLSQNYKLVNFLKPYYIKKTIRTHIVTFT